MREIVSLEKANENYGGKAKGLALLSSYGVPIPKGFVIPSEQIKKIIDKEANSIKLLKEQLSQLNSNKKLAIRSSALAEDGSQKSFAGIFQTELNVEHQIDNIIKAIINVNNSSNTAVTRAYDAGLHEMNIIVQEMINPKIAGVIFTEAIDVDGQSVVLIEMVKGLADKLVSGEISSSTMILKLDESKKILTDKIKYSGKTLEIGGIKNLIPHIQTIINQGDEAMDLEWCITDDNKPYLVQARPITKRVLIADSKSENGIIASPGIVEGKSYVIDDDLEDEEVLELIKNFPEGAILIASLTNTQYLPAIEKARGIITEEGSILSHAAIVSREMNIPCIVNYKEALELFPTGTQMTLDASNGKIMTSHYESNINLTKEMEFGDLYCYDYIIPFKIEDEIVLFEPALDGLVVHVDEEAKPTFLEEVDYLTRKTFGKSPLFLQTTKYPWFFELERFKKLPYFNELYNVAIELAKEKDCQKTNEFYESVVETEKKLVEFKNSCNEEVLRRFAEEVCVAWYFIVDMVLPLGYGLRETYKDTISVLSATNQKYGDLVNNNLSVYDDEGILMINQNYLNCLSKNRNEICEKIVEIGGMSYTYFEEREEAIQKLIDSDADEEQEIMNEFYKSIDNANWENIEGILTQNSFIKEKCCRKTNS